MKNILRFILLLLLSLSKINPLLAQWVLSTPAFGTVQSFAVSGTNLFAGYMSGGIFMSTNQGVIWSKADSGITYNEIFSFAVCPNGIGETKLFAGTRLNGVFLSTNNGISWAAVDSGLTDSYSKQVITLAVSGTNIFAGTHGGAFLSTNNGISWVAVDSGLTISYSKQINAFAVSGTDIFAGTLEGGVFLSTNNGTSWAAVNSGLNDSFSKQIFALAVSGTNIFAGTGGGLFLSTNNGTSWTIIKSAPLINYVRAIAVKDTNIFAGTDKGVFLSTNSGTSWTSISSGLIDSYALHIHSLALNDTNLFAGTEEGVWRRPLSKMITSMEDHSIDLLSHFNLSQNYPNPFNPATIITFNVPSKSFVSLKVFDIMGREVATIVSEEISAGNYSRQWNAAAFASGTYFYRLQAGMFTKTKKLLLLK